MRHHGRRLLRWIDENERLAPPTRRPPSIDGEIGDRKHFFENSTLSLFSLLNLLLHLLLLSLSSNSDALDKHSTQLRLDLQDIVDFDSDLGAAVEEAPSEYLPLVRKKSWLFFFFFFLSLRF